MTTPASSDAPVPERLDINIQQLKIAEVEAVEDLTGIPFDRLSDPNGPKAKMLRAIAYIVKRRQDPDFTWEMAGELSVDIFTPEEKDPKDEQPESES